MKITLIGKAGSGKGIQSSIIAKKTGMEHISTGDLLRSATGILKEKIDSYISKGNLIPDELMLKLLKQKIKSLNKKDIILDGFPRNINQAMLLEKEIPIDMAINIDVSDREVIKRMSGRYLCPECGKGYNSVTAPKPKKDKICNECKIPLKKRNDDRPETIKKRLEIYHKQTKPVLEFYKQKDKLLTINGEQDIQEVSKKILKKIK